MAHKTNENRSVPTGQGELANSRFHTVLFGIKRSCSDELPHCRTKSHEKQKFDATSCSPGWQGAFPQGV
jgi:hypothetical protein